MQKTPQFRFCKNFYSYDINKEYYSRTLLGFSISIFFIFSSKSSCFGKVPQQTFPFNISMPK